jgi:hypothetical protein
MPLTNAQKAIDTRRAEALEKLSPGTAATLARAYDRARAEDREVIYQYGEELHARCLSTNERAEKLRQALRARGVTVLDSVE